MIGEFIWIYVYSVLFFILFFCRNKGRISSECTDYTILELSRSVRDICKVSLPNWQPTFRFRDGHGRDWVALWCTRTAQACRETFWLQELHRRHSSWYLSSKIRTPLKHKAGRSKLRSPLCRCYVDIRGSFAAKNQDRTDEMTSAVWVADTDHSFGRHALAVRMPCTVVPSEVLHNVRRPQLGRSDVKTSLFQERSRGRKWSEDRVLTDWSFGAFCFCLHRFEVLRGTIWCSSWCFEVLRGAVLFLDLSLYVSVIQGADLHSPGFFSTSMNLQT